MENNALGLILLTSAVAGVSVACAPLFKFSKRMTFFVFLCSLLAVCMGYLTWGGYFALSDYHVKLSKVRAVDALLASPEKTLALIEHIKTRLDDSPESASGWLLIGKLYLVLHNNMEAQRAFERAAQLKH